MNIKPSDYIKNTARYIIYTLGGTTVDGKKAESRVAYSCIHEYEIDDLIERIVDEYPGIEFRVATDMSVGFSRDNVAKSQSPVTE